MLFGLCIIPDSGRSFFILSNSRYLFYFLVLSTVSLSLIPDFPRIYFPVTDNHTSKEVRVLLTIRRFCRLFRTVFDIPLRYGWILKDPSGFVCIPLGADSVAARPLHKELIFQEVFE
jgi:hypothetical protein